MNLLLTGAFKYSDDEIALLKQLGTDIIFQQDERKELDIDVSDIDAVVCNSLFLYNDIAEFTNLKYIQLTSAGLDRVPLEYIKQNNIILHNARGVYSVPMAEWALGKVLEIYNASRFFYKQQIKKEWNKKHEIFELDTKTVCVVGIGSVGTEVVKRFAAMGCHTIGVDVYLTGLTNEAFLINDIDKALEKSDVIILTMPLTSETKHLFNKQKFEIIKEDAVFVNLARGGLVKETDLIEAVQANRFIGLALDVFEDEPLPKNSPLWEMDNVIITPHNSFKSEKIQERLFQMIYKNLEVFSRNRWG